FAGDPEQLDRFKREAQAAAALGHPNIVQVVDFQWNRGEPPFLVMEHLVGTSLQTVLRNERRLEPERVATIAVQVLSGLAAAHAAGIVHRDIKPANILLCPMAALTDFVKLVDFGIAKLLDDTQLTQSGMLVGTIQYMAPEQAKGERVDGRADLFSVGVCMY